MRQRGGMQWQDARLLQSVTLRRAWPSTPRRTLMKAFTAFLFALTLLSCGSEEPTGEGCSSDVPVLGPAGSFCKEDPGFSCELDFHFKVGECERMFCTCTQAMGFCVTADE